MPPEHAWPVERTDGVGGLLGVLPLQLFALVVEDLDAAREQARLVERPRAEQRQSEARVSEPPRSVEPRREAERDVGATEPGAWANVRALPQGRDPGAQALAGRETAILFVSGTRSLFLCSKPNGFDLEVHSEMVRP